ncbi:hypothetical protein G3A_19275 [Bacillus sp. 17376]|nr:hypothetical protein G3A_19275 [Bacillus sp. 17376]
MVAIGIYTEFEVEIFYLFEVKLEKGRRILDHGMTGIFR